MFRRLFRKKDKPQAEAVEETKEEPTEHEDFEDARQHVEEDWEELNEKVDEMAESIELSVQDGKYKIWIVDHICCCMNGEEGKKKGAVTDAP